MVASTVHNKEIAGVLEHIAELLEVQKANPHRIRAYRNGARQILESKKEIAGIAESGGLEALQALPGIGDSLSRLIMEYVFTGRCRMLETLQGAVAPEDLFDEIPGIGPELAERIVRELDIKTLEELEQAAHDGRLEQVEGFGPGRVEAVRMSLAGLLSGYAFRRAQVAIAPPKKPMEKPAVGLLLAIDKTYRQKAGAGALKTIAPRRFNPENKTWLPILHTEQDGWEFTVLFSNTARAHELKRITDWVVIYYGRNGDEGQATVVTQQGGPLDGLRVVRGREKECRALYFN
ncbi:MAG: hypothetical protein KDD19_21505 [Phaeodactylibacter sp.]|nr:hypothetical protein [Phaeodactylibacter sp.]MCB9049279.1 DNA-binding protein [Lewinellaceae bacterium]